MAQILNQTQTQSSSNESASQIGVKLDGTNCALWPQVLEMYIARKDSWGAIDHMTNDSRDFIKPAKSKRTCISNANGVKYPIDGAGIVTLSSSLLLTNTLFVPSLTSKLISVGQATEELNCCVLTYPTFCLFQDILTKEIIGHGTKKGGYTTWRTSVLAR
ncbi:hypothetical protein GH714_006868 [Hevea brasiliensis]|uniref:Retrovirus-related Pol polyprotein from transposon TNT 1-94-like beta-barrel domain-containing protein n=1 Tax=Hevea brasiliensis TaxID=3981 RepID=A0A6A6M6D1_HEVBR|nr:hypothetical protein GH714_006868 [Hevea brasiliensis]